jgi:hypothetical protein
LYQVTASVGFLGQKEGKYMYYTTTLTEKNDPKALILMQLIQA